MVHISRQGALDSLCGIYSIVNIISELHKLTQEEREELFAEILIGLEGDEKKLSSLIVDGMNSKEIKDVFNLKVVSDYIKKDKSVNCRSLDEFWSTLQEKSKTHAILLGLSGTYYHWTVIDNITDKRIKLLDSDNLKHLDKSHCCISPNEDKKHTLHPRQTFYFVKSNEN